MSDPDVERLVRQVRQHLGRLRLLRLIEEVMFPVTKRRRRTKLRPSRVFEARVGAQGWAVIHHRAVGSSCYFGPFATLGAARAWCRANRVDGTLVPLYRTVDWNRR